MDILSALMELKTGGMAALKAEAESPRIEYKFNDGELILFQIDKK